MPHASIYYHPEGYVTTGQRIMGRQAAGEAFLRAAAQSGAAHLTCNTDSASSAQHFAEQLAKFGFAGEARWVPTDQPRGLADDGCLYLPGPNLKDSAWQRAPVGARAYSLCGITHTTASHLALSSITDLLTAPVRNWDALICTSKAVRDTVRYLLENQAQYLREQIGATRFELPQLPIIPLGVHTADFASSESDRAAARTSQGVGTDDIVILFVGRLAFHAKAHPQQMFTALERVAKRNPGKRVHLVQCGWYANEHIEAAFNDAARVLCPSVTMQHAEGRDPAARRQAWASADIFMSLADNIQETFGLTPIEAMAAGLPVVVSDWDGYKDTVRDGVDGFRIPTIMPQGGGGADLAQRYAIGTDSYDFHCGYASQFVALDGDALDSALERLVGDVNLRRQMGEAGRKRARSEYDWAVIYRRYQLLWEELAERRRADPDLYPPVSVTARPDRPDPFAAFAGYATGQISAAYIVKLRPEASKLEQRRNLALNSFAKSLQPSTEDCAALFRLLSERGPQSVSNVAQAFPDMPAWQLQRHLSWLAKMEAVSISIV
ncbi:MAG TPA: glycosyltransferase family 4 protein [Burkholderiaceae bacterium]